MLTGNILHCMHAKLYDRRDKFYHHILKSNLINGSFDLLSFYIKPIVILSAKAFYMPLTLARH